MNPGCANLSAVSIPTSVSYIGDAAFQDCSKLSTVVIPTSVSYLGIGVFQGIFHYLKILYAAEMI